MLSTEKRIQAILERKRQEKLATEQAQSDATEAEEKRRNLETQVQQKWATDTHIIKGVLKDLEQRLSELGIKFSFEEAPGNAGVTVAIGRCQAKVGNAVGKMIFNVQKDGTLKVFHEDTPIKKTGADHIKLLQANKATYEEAVLGFVELMV
jgi:hypothetical protein